MFLFLLEIAAIATEPATHSSAVDFTFLFIKMIAALVVACTLAVIILKYAVPRLSFTKKLSAEGPIKILNRVSLGPKQHLFLVKIKEKCILLGVTDHSINRIDEVNYEEKP
ncbi:MAG: flagellar biosynthetic protein FliO [Deltaproteobacteria bacterium CG11_big_fil_rev_8_21_14_0_20_49_13]|nr:MAG: flagellar biosynthetic protein FliO [Deltaproteobacteria bacterium CG11_big_fil_rev_8_21_14_0_20_49_13]